MRLMIEANVQSGYVNAIPAAGGYVFHPAIYPRESVVEPAAIRGAFVGTPAPITWTDDVTVFDGQHLIQEVSIQIVRTSDDMLVHATGWIPNPVGDPHYDGWIPTPSDVGEEFRAIVTFRNHLAVDEFGVPKPDHEHTSESEGGYLVYAASPTPLTYANRSSDHATDPAQGSAIMDYAGTPYSAIPLDYDQDGREDLFVTQAGFPALLYNNLGMLPNDAPDMDNSAGTAFAQGDEPLPDSRGASAQNFDKSVGGHPDLFVAHEDGGRIYQNTNGSFVLLDLPTAIDGALKDSWTGAWGDYDGDSHLDLFVGRADVAPGGPPQPDPDTVIPLVPTLLRNSLFDGGGVYFTDVSGPNESGIVEGDLFGNPTDPGIACVSAEWVDIDGDGDVDLVAGSLYSTISAPSSSRLYVNQGDGTFTEEWASRIGSPLGHVSSVACGNLEGPGGDVYPEIVLGLQKDDYTDPFIFWNDGISFTQENVDAGLAVTSLALLDYNNDLRLDILATADEETGTGQRPLLLRNVEFNGSPTFVEDTSVGLDETGAAFGIAIANFDDPTSGDLYPDIFIGRPKASRAFYYRAEETGSGASPVSALLVGGGGNPTTGIGAKVALRENGHTIHWTSISGGSGRGGQPSREVAFGTEDLTGTLDLEISWPDGGTQIQPVTPGQSYTIQDATSPSILTTSQDVDVSLGPGATMDLTFTWDTQNASRNSLDEVHVSSSCLSTDLVFRPSSYNATHSVVKLGNGNFRHTLTIAGLDCLPTCSYSYYCVSATDFVSSDGSGSPETFRTKICLQ